MRSLRAALLLAVIDACLHAPAVVPGTLISPSGMMYTLSPWQPYRPLVSDALRFNDVISDALYQFDPWHVEYLQSIGRGEWPLWTPAAYCGAPFAANMQTAVFFPLNLLAWLIPALWTFTLAALIKLWLAGWFTYLFLRRRGVTDPAALLGAVGFMCGGFMTVWMAHPHTQSAMILPAMFWAVDLWVSRRGVLPVAALACAAGVGWLGGHPETALHAVAVPLAYALYRAVALGEVPLRRLVALAASQLLGLALAAVQLLPFAEYLTQGHVMEQRTSTLMGDGIPLGTAITLLVPKFFGEHQRFTWWETDLNRVAGSLNEMAGYAGLALTLLAVISLGWPHPRRELRFFQTLAAASFVLVYWPGLHVVLDHVPVLSFTSQSRLLCELGFALAVCGAFALDRLLSARAGGVETRLRSWNWGGCVVLAATIAGYWWSFREDARSADPYFDVWCAGAVALLVVYAGSIELLARWGGRASLRGAAGWTVLAIGAAELWGWSHGYVGFVRERDLYPATALTELLRADRTLYRVLGLDDMLPVNLQIPYGLSSVEGYDVVEMERHQRLLEVLRRWSRSESRGAVPVEVRELLDRLNVKYLLTQPGVAVEGRDLRLAYDAADGRVYVNETVWPRAFWVERDAFRRGALEPGSAARVDLMRYEPHRSAWRVATPAAGYLVVTDAWFPGWRARLDDEDRPVELAGDAFRAVELPAGEHAVAFEYRPAAFRAGAAITLATLVGLTALGLVAALGPVSRAGRGEG